MAEVAAEVQRSRSCSFIPSLPRANHHHLLSLSSSHHLTTVAPTPFQPLSSPYVPSTKNMRYQVESTMCVVAPSRQLARQLAHTLPQPPRRAEGRREWTLDEIDAEWNETTKQSESWARQVADIPLCTIYPRAEIETFIIQIGLALQAKYATNDHQQPTTYSMCVLTWYGPRSVIGIQWYACAFARVSSRSLHRGRGHRVSHVHQSDRNLLLL